MPNNNQSLIGNYGTWAAGLLDAQLPRLSFRSQEFTKDTLVSWRQKAKAEVFKLLACPTVDVQDIKMEKKYEWDGLYIEEISWQLNYGRRTKAVVLRPANVKGKLPAILGLHDHGGNKYFGLDKITRLSQKQHPDMLVHQQHYYDGLAWANEVAKRGYVVMVHDTFPFASRKVWLEDVPPAIRMGTTDVKNEDSNAIAAYNKWAGEHEHIMAKSLFSAGITWPGVFLQEDRIALDILAARNDADGDNIGCAGLSGGGMRTVFLGGLDERIKCAVCVGFMTTWKDLVLHKSYTHTWMTYVPLLPQLLDLPEILGLRVPLPVMVQHDNEDDLYTLEEMQKSDTILSAIYDKAGAAARYKCNFYPGPHKFDKKMQHDAFEWFDHWLR